MVLNRLMNALWQPEKKPRKEPGAYTAGGYYSNGDTAGAPQKELPNTTLGLALASTVSIYGGKAMMVRMQAVESMEWQIKSANNTVISHSRDRNPTHPLARAIRRVYNDQYNTFFALVEQSRCIWGETFVEKVSNEYGTATGLYWLNNLGMYFYAPRGVIEWFRYTSPGGGMVQYTPNEIGYSIATKSPSDDLRGISPMELALQTTNLDNNSTQFLLSYWRNMARPGLVISPKEGVYTQDDMDLVSSWLSGNMKGVKQAGKTLLLPKATDIATLDYDDPEIHTEARRTLQREILVAFGVPPAVIGDTEDTGYKPSEENQYWLYANTIIPECTGIEQWINADLLPFFDPRSQSYFEFDTSPFDRVSEADKAQQDLLEQRYKSGAIDYYTYQRESGNEKTDERWRNAYYVESLGAPVPADEYATLWKYNVQTPPTDYTPPPVEPVIAPEVAQTTPTEPAVIDPTKDLGEPLFVGLSLADNPDVIGLQKQVMSLAPDPAVKWTHPNDYHVTLFRAPAADETAAQTFIEAVKELPIPELKLKMGSLYTFDRMGKHALTSLIRRNQALLDYQAQVYDLAQEFGIECEGIYTPAQYKPHVTLAYIPEHMRQVTYQGKVTVTPKGVKCDYGDSPLWRSWEVETEPPEPPLDAEAMTDELKTFLKYTRKHSQSKALGFVFNAVPDSLADAIRYRLSQADDIEAVVSRTLKAIEGEYDENVSDYAAALERMHVHGFTAVKAVVAHYAGILAAKSYDSVRSRFEDALTSEMLAAFNERRGKAAFIRRMEQLLYRYLRLAVIAGFEDAGIEDFNLDSDDEDAVEANNWIDAFVDDQRQYIANVADALYADDALTEDEIRDNKPTLWFNKSIAPGYNWALSSASKNALGIFVLGNAEQHCRDCSALDGIAVRFSKWLKYFGDELPPCSATECGGWKCQCSVKPYRGKKFRGTLPLLHGEQRAA